MFLLSLGNVSPGPGFTRMEMSLQEGVHTGTVSFSRRARGMEAATHRLLAIRNYLLPSK